MSKYAPVVEHVEAVVAGMRVRTKVGAVHRDRTRDRMFLQTLLDPGVPAQRPRVVVTTYPPAPIDPAIREMPIEVFAETYALASHRRAVRVNPDRLSEAC